MLRGIAGAEPPAASGRRYMLYYPVGAAIGACEGVTKATYEAVTTLPPVLLKDPALLVKVGGQARLRIAQALRTLRMPLGCPMQRGCPADACRRSPWAAPACGCACARGASSVGEPAVWLCWGADAGMCLFVQRAGGNLAPPVPAASVGSIAQCVRGRARGAPCARRGAGAGADLWGGAAQGTKNNKKVDMNGFVEEPKRAMENGVKAAHETAHSAAAHAKKAHLPADSKIAQMSNKPMAHVEAKGELPRGRGA